MAAPCPSRQSGHREVVAVPKAEFALFEAWDEKYEYIIDMGKRLPGLPEADKTEANKIKGCQSNVWLTAEIQGNLLYFHAESDSMIVRGLVSLLIRVLSGQPAADIYGSDLYFIERIGMAKHLAQTRSNGLLSMLKQMKFYALAYQARTA